MKKYKAIGIIAILVIIGIGLICSYISGGNKELIKNDKENIFVEEDSTLEETKANENQIVVEIKGEINKPDVYWVSEDSIIEDLINLAGGITEGADLTKINRAEKLINHESIVIPNKNQEGIEETTNTSSNNSTNNLININTATAEELQSLPGIGPSKAGEIIHYRDENGEFSNIEDLKNVSGIGNASFEKLKDKIRI